MVHPSTILQLGHSDFIPLVDVLNYVLEGTRQKDKRSDEPLKDTRFFEGTNVRRNLGS